MATLERQLPAEGGNSCGLGFELPVVDTLGRSSSTENPAGAKPRRPPFIGHAWVEAEGRLVEEGVGYDYFSRLITVD